MARRNPNSSNDTPANTVRLFGRDYPVIERLRIHGRVYLLLERVSIGHRERYLGFDPTRGPRGGAVCVTMLPRSEASTRQHIKVLQRNSESNAALPDIYDFDVQNDKVVFVTRWIRGVTLSRFLADITEGRQKRISSIMAFQRIHGLAHGISRWHQRGQWNHGDIKPENIIVSTDPGRFILIDFGSAWLAQSAAFRQLGDGVSPFYAAPEQLTPGVPVNFRVDQFSLTAVLYQLLTLQLPFEGLGGRAGVGLRSKADGPMLVPASELAEDREKIPRTVWKAIDRVVSRGLAFNPDDRYPTPQAWLDDLDEVALDIKRPPSESNRLITGVLDWFTGRQSSDNS